MSSSVRHVRLKRTFYPSEALRERICIVDLYRRRDFFFFPNEVVLKYANSALLTNSDELVIYSDSLPVVPHLEIGDKSSDKLPTRVSKWRVLYPRAPWSFLSWLCITAHPARLSINDSRYSTMTNSTGAHSASMLGREKVQKSCCLQEAFEEQKGWGGAAGTPGPVPKISVMWGQEHTWLPLVPQPPWAPRTGWNPAAPTTTLSGNRDCKTAAPKRPILKCGQLSIQRSSFLHCWLAKLSKDPLSHTSWAVPVPQPGQGSGGLSTHLHHFNMLEKQGDIRAGGKLMHNKTPENKTPAQRNLSVLTIDFCLVETVLRKCHLSSVPGFTCLHQPTWPPPWQSAIGFQCNVSGKSNCFSRSTS